MAGMPLPPHAFLGPNVPRSLLLLGLGGATVVRQLLHLLPELKITAIDLNPLALSVSKRNLGPLADSITMIHADAYSWLAQCSDQFDVVIDDIYACGPEDVFRPRPMDPSLAEFLKSRTAERGVVVANLLTGSGHRSMQIMARAAFRSTFAQLRSVRPPRGFNSILVGGARLLPGSALLPWRHAWSARDCPYWDQLRLAR